MFLRQYNAENIFNIQRNMIQKIYQINICILFLITNLFLLNCQKEKEISFYYWKTNFTLSKKESEALKHFKTKEIYLRFFDVDKKEKDNPIPLGVIGKISCPADTSIIPVVYITNHTFHHFRKEDAESLAQKVFSKIDSIAKENSISYNEIQIDCDWSDSTRELYFSFLGKMKSISQKTISTTIRLHQVKYFERTGIPPVDKYVLMFYNMGKLGKTESNSIYNSPDAAKYIQSLNKYPKKLDIALPIFSWVIHKRGGVIQELLKDFDLQKLQDKGILKTADNPDTFLVTKSTLTGGKYFREEDELYLERISQEELLNAATLLNSKAKNLHRKIIFFDLDETNFFNYPYEFLDQVCNRIF